MVVAMSAVRVMEMTGDQVVDMIAMRDRVVPASGAVDMAGVVLVTGVAGGTGVGVRRADRDHVLVDVIPVWVVQVAVVGEVDMTVVNDRGVAAAGAVDMVVCVVLRHMGTVSGRVEQRRATLLASEPGWVPHAEPCDATLDRLPARPRVALP